MEVIGAKNLLQKDLPHLTWVASLFHLSLMESLQASGLLSEDNHRCLSPSRTLYLDVRTL